MSSGNNYTKAQEALHWLTKHSGLGQQSLEYFKAEIVSGLFEQATNSDEISKIYRGLDKKDQTSSVILQMYEKYLGKHK